MTKTIQIYTNQSFTTEIDGTEILLTIKNVDSDNLVTEFSAKELLNSITDHFGFSTIVDYVNESMEDNE